MPAAERPRPATPARVAAACLAGTVAFWAYTSTLLPGVDPGDTGGFQAAVLWPETSARQAYPLYYTLAKPFVRAVSPANPARGLNLFSAVWAAAAVGLLAWVATLVSGSLAGGVAAALLLTFSYTFWTQAVIAEVYTLHLAFVAACLAALDAYAARPTTPRLALFMALYALSFGNHFSMILLFVPFAVFVLQVHPQPRQLFRPRVVALALALAGLGALQYTGNFLAAWASIDASQAWTDRLATFWFDVTKADWRETMVFGVSPSETRDRLAMWVWDARQQFGGAGIVLAVAGWVRLWPLARPWAVLVTLAYGISTLFALTYNVGDPHVFFLPGHLLTAFAAAAALAPAAGGRAAFHARPGTRRLVEGTVAAAVFVYAAWRGWDTWPAADRHRDVRADRLVAGIAGGVDDTRAILLTRLDWQTENALLYASRYERRDLAWTRLADVMLHFPFLVRDNHAIGRDVVLSAGAAAEVIAAFGPAFAIAADEAIAPRFLPDVLGRLPRGTPYVLTLLTPPSDEPFDPAVFDLMLSAVAPAAPPREAGARYEVWAGLSGDSPFYVGSARPFRVEAPLLGDSFTVRMDAWLPFDNFRRGGFGHVLRGREPVLTIERGASIVWFEGSGAPVVAYYGGLYAPEARFRIPAGATLGLAALPQ